MQYQRVKHVCPYSVIFAHYGLFRSFYIILHFALVCVPCNTVFNDIPFNYNNPFIIS